ncbi:fatty acyl-CoA reductase wat-like [Diorhabda carinulata]|uniref:fatty acyl-CoA reductase wat-like n=1 Tax=Diorhabda carinulata TaxID=1163345 RepID=UPI0025A2F36F|nr:fatty acyl-CoA reductase wat-like [Diorhabda carinulata]
MDRSNQSVEDEREGGDITFADMVVEDSELLKFYNDSTILLTGATGYLGKLHMEKLLRVCNVKKIFIIVRAKKGKDPEKRLEELFNDPSYAPLKRKYPNFTRKIHLMAGDAALPNLGLCEEDIETIKSEVDCVFHYAATVRFDEKLRIATYINVRAVRDLIRIAKDIKKLRAFVHISTAYSNCVQSTIEEKFYDPPIMADKLITLVDCLDDNQLDAITKSLLGDFPNTYAFTKCIAEDILRTEGKKLPIALYRPSIVIATLKEPVAGWINNVYGATGVLIGVAIGLLRTLRGNPKNYADMVPADYVINGVLASAWDVACIKTMNDNKELREESSREEQFDKEIPVYNYVSTPEKPISWDQFQRLSTKHATQIPSEKVIWHSYFRMIQNKWLFLIASFLLHTIPAHVVDFIAVCVGKKPMLVKGYAKINKFADVLSYFCQRQWVFTNNNIQSLWQRLNKRDKELFEFSMKLLDWDLYFYTYTRGGRLYILEDPLETIPKGKIKYIKMLCAHYALMAFLLAAFIKIIMIMCNLIF